MNIIKIQDDLKKLSDDQIAQEMRMPSGAVPQFLIMTEMQRRKEMRDGAAAGQAGDQPSIAEEMVAQAQPQGIVGLPDETLAGAAMRARILGEQQQVGDMTVNPPQEPQTMARGGYVDYMAEGGAPQFRSLFGGAPAGQQAAPSFGAQAPDTGEAQLAAYNAPIIPQVVPADRTAARASGPDLGNFDPTKNQYYVNRQRKASPAITPENYGYDQNQPFRMNLPPGVPKPREGVAGMLTQDRGRDRRVNYFANPEARDSYIRSYIPSWNQPKPATTSKMAEGGIASLMQPKRMAEGDEVDSGGMGSNVLDILGRALVGNPLLGPGYLVARGAESYLDRKGLEAKAEAERARAAEAERARTAGPGASPTAAVSGTPSQGGNPPMPRPKPSTLPDDGLANPKPAATNSFLQDYQTKVSDLLDKLSGSEADDERAKNMAIMKAGLAIAAGKDPNFLTNVATGAMAGVEDYGSSRDAAKKAEMARAAAEVEALGAAARLQQAENERADTAAYRERALDIEDEYKRGMLGVYGGRGGTSTNAASLRALTSLYSSISGQLKANPFMEDTERAALEGQLADIRAALSDVDPALLIGGASAGGGAGPITAEQRAAAAAKLKALGIEP
jgi:hypothetical protein